MTPRQIALQFGDYGSAEPGSEPFFYDFSGIAARGRTLWLVSDEGACLDQLTCQPDGSYADHQRLRLADFLTLPEGDGELDLESLALNGKTLWLLGSHAAVRRKPAGNALDPEDAVLRLSQVKRQQSRELLASLPIAAVEEDLWTPLDAAAEASLGSMVRIGRKGSQLLKQLRKDPHLGRFLSIPAKENGFDAEGLAVAGERLFLGLRGPVLRGWAVVLELMAKPPIEGRVGLRRLGAEGERYLKHFLDLDGLGIRDLALDGEDLYILAGPTMDLDGPLRVYRWPGTLVNAGPALVERSQLDRVLDLAALEGSDRAEGLAIMEHQGEKGFVIVHDRPAAARRDPVAGRLDLDFYPIAG